MKCRDTVIQNKQILTHIITKAHTEGIIMAKRELKTGSRQYRFSLQRPNLGGETEYLLIHLVSFSLAVMHLFRYSQLSIRTLGICITYNQ